MTTISYKEIIVLVSETCVSCGITFAVPESYQQNLKNSHKSFCCPNGHSQYYSGKSEAEKLRDELKRKEQELADTAIEKRQLQNDIAEKERNLKRLHNGVCPCCNRSFVNLQKHIKEQHPYLVPKQKPFNKVFKK